MPNTFSNRLRPYFGIFVFFLIFGLTLVLVLNGIKPDILSIFLNVISFVMVIGLFAVFVPYSFAFPVCFISSVASPAFIILIWFTQKGFLGTPFPMLAMLAVAGTWILAQLKTFKKNLLSTRQLEIILVLFSFYSFSGIVAFSNPGLTIQPTEDMMFIFGLILFWIVSLQITNMTLRAYLINKILNTSNRLKLLEQYRNKLEKKVDAKQYTINQVDFMLYYLAPALEEFILGNFEGSYENAFKIVFDEEFDKIYKVQDYDKKRPTFAHIRNTLAHAQAHSAKIKKVEDIRNVKNRLFDDTQSLLIIVKEFMDTVTS